MELTLNARPLSPLAGEAALVDAARHGDDRAFEQLYARYRDRIHAFILSKVRDHGRAEDLGQEVFMSALRQLRASDREIVFKPWLYTIAKNACIDEFRRGARAREVSIESEEELGAAAGERFLSAVPTPAAAVESKQSLDDLRGAFSGLSDSQHKLLVMREFEGLTYDEIGERLGMTKQMVESGLFRARRRLGEEYDELASGRRCEQIQTAIDTGVLRTVRGMGIKDKRRYSRHLSHCQLCRHQALMAGIDEALLTKRSLAAKVAALLPFPLLRKLWPFGHGGGAASGAGGAVAGGGAAAAGAAGAGVGQAAAIAALALAGAGGGLVIAEHASHHHAAAPAPAVRHHVAPSVAPAQRTTPHSGAVHVRGTTSRAAHHRAAQAARKAAAGAQARSRAAVTAPAARATTGAVVAPARATRGAAAPIANPIEKTRKGTRLPVAAPSRTTPTSPAPTATSPTSSPPTGTTPTHTKLTITSPVSGTPPIPPTVSNPVTTTLSGVGTAAGSATASAGTAAGSTVTDAGAAAGAATGAVGSAAGTAVTKVGAAAGTAVGAAGTSLGTAVGGVGAGTPVGGLTGALGGAVAGASQGAGSAVGGVAGAVGSTATGATAATGTTVTGATGAVGTTLAGATQGVGSAVGGLLGGGN